MPLSGMKGFRVRGKPPLSRGGEGWGPTEDLWCVFSVCSEARGRARCGHWVCEGGVGVDEGGGGADGCCP